MPIIIEEKETNHYLDSVRFHQGFTICKSPDLIFVGGNQPQALLTGFKTIPHMIGKNDFEVPCKSSDQAEIYRAACAETFQLNTDRTFLCFNEFKGGWKLLLSSHTLVQNQQHKPLVLTITTHDLTYLPLMHTGVMLNTILLNNIQHHIPFHAELLPQYRKLPLSKRQSETLCYLLHGYTAKEIGRTLNLSARTIECYIEQIKIILNCQTRSQIIEKATAEGLLNYFVTESK